ncbi:energy transducer TonB [Hymenobacter rigui]|nr:energy transducer TonB [Hymenobacter rigui]
MKLQALTWGAIVLVLTAAGQARAQAAYNRWEAKPVTPRKAATTPAQRGRQVMQAKNRQDFLNQVQALHRDSLRIVASGAAMPLLQRGIGQRIKENHILPEDNQYYDYLRRTIRYPTQALRAQAEGKITMRLTINTTGQVSNLEEVENTIPAGAAGRAEMVRQVVVALRQLRFEAGPVTTEELTFGYKFL